MLFRSFLLLTVSVALAGTASATSRDRRDDPSYDLPVVVRGKTSMRQAMGTSSTFSFKTFQRDGQQKPEPYSYPEPDSNR